MASFNRIHLSLLLITIHALLFGLLYSFGVFNWSSSSASENSSVISSGSSSTPQYLPSLDCSSSSSSSSPSSSSKSQQSKKFKKSKAALLKTLPQIRGSRCFVIASMQTMHDRLMQHGIHYTVIKGTLLGIARSRSILPHDDDCDMQVLEEDAPRVIALFESHPGWKVRDMGTWGKAPYWGLYEDLTVTKRAVVGLASAATKLKVCDIFTSAHGDPKTYLKSKTHDKVRRGFASRDQIISAVSVGFDDSGSINVPKDYLPLLQDAYTKDGLCTVNIWNHKLNAKAGWDVKAKSNTYSMALTDYRKIIEQPSVKKATSCKYNPAPS